MESLRRIFIENVEENKGQLKNEMLKLEGIVRKMRNEIRLRKEEVEFMKEELLHYEHENVLIEEKLESKVEEIETLKMKCKTDNKNAEDNEKRW